MAEAKWAVEERKLSQALDDLGDGQYKLAQNAIDKHLKKHPKSQPALALRMALLERTGSSQSDVLAVYEKVKATGELTSRSIWLVTTSFRSLRRGDLSLKLYNDLWEAQPSRPELGEQVFLHAAAAWDTEMMVGSSRKMFNAQKSAVWARVAAWSEWVAKSPQPTTKTPVPPPAPEKALQVAKLLLNTAKPSTGLSPDTFWLKLQILISAGDLVEALKVAQEGGEEGSLSRLWFRMESVPVILDRLGGDQHAAWEVEWDWVKEKIQSEKDCQRNYAFYRYLLKTVSHVEQKIEETKQFFADLDHEFGPKERAPLLALLEMDNSVPELKRMSTGEWEKMVNTYWSRWGSKGSIVTELEGIATVPSKREYISRILVDRSSGSHSDLQAYREIVNAKTYLLRQRDAAWTSSQADVKDLWDLYLSGLAYGRNVPSTDIQPADDVGLSAVHLLLIRWSQDKADESLLNDALACLRYISNKSSSSAHAKYLYNRVARLLGATSTIPETYFTTAGPTEIQYDTLLHNTVDRASGEVHIGSMNSKWTAQLSKAEKVYKRTANDIPEYLKQALQNESYSKLHEFKEVQQTLEHSLPRAISMIEGARAQLVSGQAVDQSTLDEIKSLAQKAEDGLLVDTRDWGLFPDIGGNLPRIKDILVLGDLVRLNWVSEWGRLLHVICEYAKTVDVTSLTLPQSEGQGLLPAEKAVRAGFEAYFDWSKQVVFGAGEAPDISDAFSGLVEIATGDKADTRWLRVYNLFLLLEATKNVDVIYKRLQIVAQTKPAGKGKKTVDQHLTNRIKGTKPLRDGLNEKMREIVAQLDELIVGDESAAWADVGKDFFEDGTFVQTLRKEVVEARVRSLRNAQNLFQGRKI